MATRHRFKMGHVYSIDYDDHYCVHSEGPDEPAINPAVLRTRGVMVGETKKLLILEDDRVLSTGHVQRLHRNAIVKSCITRVQHFGKEN